MHIFSKFHTHALSCIKMNKGIFFTHICRSCFGVFLRFFVGAFKRAAYCFSLLHILRLAVNICLVHKMFSSILFCTFLRFSSSSSSFSFRFISFSTIVYILLLRISTLLRFVRHFTIYLGYNLFM